MQLSVIGEIISVNRTILSANDKNNSANCVESKHKILFFYLLITANKKIQNCTYNPG
jgi:hypothetical protein